MQPYNVPSYDLYRVKERKEVGRLGLSHGKIICSAPMILPNATLSRKFRNAKAVSIGKKKKSLRNQLKFEGWQSGFAQHRS
jgi:hypothetical protein